jgi:hypothetical protein
VGHGIVRGRDIALQPSLSQDGRQVFELVPIEGDFEFAAYSTVDAVVKVCEERGVPADVWPIYSGIDDYQVQLDDVRRRCESLQKELAKVRLEDIAAHWWMRKVCDWLAAGEIFCIMD